MGIEGSKGTDKTVLNYTNGDKYEGELINGQREGYGVYYYHNGDKYEGIWLQNKKHGMGSMYYKDGNMYVGQWKYSEKEGTGVFYSRSGEKFEGEFVNSKRHGKGKLTSADGTIFQGEFFENKKHGESIITFMNKKQYREKWEHGILKSSKLVKAKMMSSDAKMISNSMLPECKQDESFQEYIDQTEHDKRLSTVGLAKYFKVKIPNNYFDALHLVSKASEQIFSNPRVTEWSESEVLQFVKNLGLKDFHKHESKIKGLNGLDYIKLNIPEIKKLGIEEQENVHLILKSVDFLRIFMKIKFDYEEFFLSENKNTSSQPQPTGTITPKTETIISTNNIIAEKVQSSKKGPYNLVDDELILSTTTNDKLTRADSEDKVGIRKLVFPRKHKQKSMMLIKKTNKQSANTEIKENKDMVVINNDDSIDVEEKEEKADNSNEEENDGGYYYVPDTQEYVITKVSLTKLILHSLNLTGFSFFIRFEELKFLDKIGEGGFGVVYSGLWHGKMIAIKKFHAKEKYPLKSILNKYIREINTISNIRHPNVVLYIGASINKNDCYMIGEYISKGSLFDYLHITKETLNEDDQISIAFEIAVAVKYLHSRKILHCDLKSSNILLDEKLKVKISDFGLSKVKSLFNENELKGRIGTPHWMPPEVMCKKEYTEASDVFSYGMILWEILSKEVPYYGLTPNQIIGQVADFKKIVEPPVFGNPCLKNLVKNCLLYDPKKRPTFDQIIKFLEKSVEKSMNHDYLTEEIYNFIS